MWIESVLIVSTIIASAMGTISGFGVGTVMTPVLLLLFPLPETVVFVAIIHWFHNIWKPILFGLHIDWPIFFYFGVPGIVTSYLGARLIAGTAVSHMSALFGFMLICYVFFLYINPQFVVKRNNTMAFVGGAVSGFFAGLIGIRGAIKNAFLAAFNLPKEVYIVTNGVISIVMDTTRLITYWYGGMVMRPLLWYCLPICIGASFFGAWIARFVIDKVPQDSFRYVVALFIFAVGVRLLFFPLLS